MSMVVMRGQKTDLTKKYPGISEVLVSLGWEATGNIEIDVAAFLLQGNGKCRGEEDFIFYGNPNGRNGSVSVQDPRNPDKVQVKVNLRVVPSDVERIAFSLTIYEGPQRGHSFGQIPGSYIRVATTNNEELIRFNMGHDFKSETAVVVAELYRHNGEWKFNTIAMGYQGGLEALCGGFGIIVDNQLSSQETKDTISTKEMTKPKLESPKPKLDLSKIELTKRGEKVILEKKVGNKLGEIVINLNWNQRKKQPKGFFNSIFGGDKGSGDKGIDLDLGCLYEMKNGEKFVIQALGESFGSSNEFPYISLDGDDRTGGVSTGENLRINGNFIHQLNRILVFTFIYEGIANWAQADGVVTIKQPDGPDIVVRLDEHDPHKTMCAIAMIENINNETLSVERLVRYFPGHIELDNAFDWGLQWTSGTKD